jgi:hypothetical protein
MEPEYRLAVEVGDVVRMPCGVEAEVVRVDFPATFAYHVKQLALRPRANILYRAWLFLTGESRPYEQDINQLVKVGSVA